MSVRFERLDPRFRLLLTLAAIALVSSSPAMFPGPFGVFAVLTGLLWMTSRAGVAELLWRTLPALPIVVLAAAVFFLRELGTPSAGQGAAAIAVKGALAAALLALLSASTTMPELIWSLRKLRVPEPFCAILTLMARYVDVISEEYVRSSRARQSRCVTPLARLPRAIVGRQFGMLFLRTADRAERIYQAMLSRGFTGGWPMAKQRPAAGFDYGFLVVSVILFGVARILAGQR
jgi:cobalt/nickel transport system permease protein